MFRDTKFFIDKLIKIANKYSLCKKSKYAALLVLKDYSCKRDSILYYTTNGAVECKAETCKRLKNNIKSGTLNYKDYDCNAKHAEEKIVELFENDKLFYRNKSYSIDIYINAEPCLKCALAILRLASQIDKIVYLKTRNYNLEGIELLKDNNINILEYKENIKKTL